MSASISVTKRTPSMNSTNTVLRESVMGLMTSDELQTHRHILRHTDTQTDRHTDTETDRHTDKQRDIQAHKHCAQRVCHGTDDVR